MYKISQEPCLNWHLLMFPMETFRVQIPPLSIIELSGTKKKKTLIMSRINVSIIQNRLVDIEISQLQNTD